MVMKSNLSGFGSASRWMALSAVTVASCVFVSPAISVAQDAKQVSTRRNPEPRKTSALPTQVSRINELIERDWAEYELKPSKDATDGEWCRRVFLDVIGRTPTVDEARSFMASKEDDKRLALVKKLLYSDDYTEEFARNWTTVWTNLLIGRTGGTANNSMINREGMQKYLRDSFARGKPYDRMVDDLITATGTTAPGDPDFNGATNFLIDKVNQEDATLATSATTRVFLGLQVQCAQCHKHPFNEWEQETYWQMNAFFRQVKAFPRRMRAETGANAELADQDFASRRRRDFEEAEIYFESRNGLMQVAWPVFVDGAEIGRSGLVNVVNRRQELSKLIQKSPFLDQTIANRMWAHFLGYGFTSPVDDLGPHNIPSNPELLEYLGSEFRTAQYDLRELMKWIVLSKPYALSSRQTKANESDDPLQGVAPRFSHFYIRQMQPEQLYESLLVNTEAASRGTYEEQERRKSRWLQQFNRAFGTDEGGESTDFNGTIPQVLMMFNGEMIQEATKANGGSVISQLVASGGTPRDKVNKLFFAGLSRPPSSQETRMAMGLIQSQGDLGEGLRDLWWVILNSNEFIFNH
ncbi:hypothetical protein MFFC18_12430 [Mariniblastus fucicola]|uniref:Cytochrome c domain-containing protein n=2 Tax=Mariniblastus fucicola TaxID=980251 RepID=A0A5B9P441_9BACT|nr:hypothetical protein MFFC18_12430 [Mariniblastus fucicola]